MNSFTKQVIIKKRIRSAIIIFAVMLFLPGCATYKFHHGKLPYDKGYVVSRDDYTILEYTLGKDNTVPKLKLAKERFKRRRNIIEDYYKRMGYIENHFKMAVWDPCIYFIKMVGGVFRLPFVAISDYRYNRNAKYREKIKKREAEQDLREEERINRLKEKVTVYIQRDLMHERASAETEQEIAEEKAPEIKPEPQKESIQLKTEQPIAAVEEKPEVKVEEKPEPKKEEEKVITPPAEQPLPEAKKEIATEEKPKTQELKVETPEILKKQSAKLSQPPVAVIIAKPTKGYSPLKVQFYGNRSYAPRARIVSYSWDFGDGDTSTKTNPINTYYSGSFEPCYFTVTLTVQDDKGRTATTNTTIEALNK